MTSITVWSHQLLRGTRQDSALASGFKAAYLAVAIVLLATAIYAMTILPPGSDILQAVGGDVSSWMMRNSLALTIAVFLGNLWLSGQSHGEFGPYRFMPISLPALSVALQCSRAFRIRYLVLYAVVMGLYVCVLKELTNTEIIVGILTIILIDASSTIVLVMLRRKYLVAIGMGVITSFAVLIDFMEGSYISNVIYHSYVTIGSNNMIVWMGIVVAAVIEARAVYVINDELRYGS